MRICLICEGCYPYIPGGVSSWIHMICNQFTDIEFIIWSIATTREEMSKAKYKIPENVKEVRTMYLAEQKIRQKHRKLVISTEEKQILKDLMIGSAFEINWKKTLQFIKHYRRSLEDLLMGEDVFDICLEEYKKVRSKKVFHHFLWNFRGMYFPLMYILSEDIPEADIYHSVSTGYAGILGSSASYVNKKPFILSEHGIYTREREEDIIRSDWVAGDFKGQWIEFFKRLSYIAYFGADVVTSLFHVNKTLQIELGCPEEKIQIIPNGVSPEEYENLPTVQPMDPTKYHIGAIVRVVPIKDIKTMLLAFSIVKERYPHAYLHIMGNCDENPEYYQDCRAIVEELNISDVEFLGQVNVKEYLPGLQLLLLSSISEGQPLAILEGMAAGIPYISTNVGDCKDLLEGRDDDDFGPAGRVVPAMNSEAMAEAISYFIQYPEESKKMGEAGKKRVQTYYRKDSFMKQYRELYERLS